MVKENSPISEQQYLNSTNSLSSAASKSLKDLINSLSQEQIFNQDLLLSLSFALRSFTNLQRFLELIPLLVTQLVGVKGSLLIPFQDNGSLWREQLQMVPIDEDQELFRQLFLLEEGKKSGFEGVMPDFKPQGSANVGLDKSNILGNIGLVDKALSLIHI